MFVSSWYTVILFIKLNLIISIHTVQISQDQRNNNDKSIILRRRQSNDTHFLPSLSSSSSTTALIAGSYTVPINRIDLILLISNQNELPISYELIKPTLELAIQDAAKRYPHLQFYLNPVYDENPCQSNVLGALAAEKYYTGHVSAFFGPICSLALDPVSRMASYWNVPVFTSGGISYQFSNKQIFTTLTRVSYSLGNFFSCNLCFVIIFNCLFFFISYLKDRLSHFFLKIFQVYGWQHIALIVDETDAANKLIKTSMQSIFKETEFGYEIFLETITYEIKSSNTTIDYQKMLRQASRNARGKFIILNF